MVNLDLSDRNLVVSLGFIFIPPYLPVLNKRDHRYVRWSLFKLLSMMLVTYIKYFLQVILLLS